MAKDFDPRRILRKISNTLLRQCYERHGAAAGIPWNELRETQIEPMFSAWQQMPDDKRRHIQLVLQDINELADERGMVVLVEELRHTSSEHLDTFNALESHADRAMWCYLNARGVFTVAAYFARAEALARGRYWIKRNSLPKQAINVTPAIRETLEHELKQFYWNEQLRGRVCKVEHYSRAGGSEYFFAYLDDYRVGFNRYFREWVCFDHTGYARTKAEAWWRARSVEPVPGGTEEAVEMAKAGALAPTLSITVDKKAGDQFERVTQHVLGDKPPRLDSDEGLPDRPPKPAGMTYGIPDEEIPF